MMKWPEKFFLKTARFSKDMRRYNWIYNKLFKINRRYNLKPDLLRFSYSSLRKFHKFIFLTVPEKLCYASNPESFKNFSCFDHKNHSPNLIGSPLPPCIQFKQQNLRSVYPPTKSTPFKWSTSGHTPRN